MKFHYTFLLAITVCLVSDASALAPQSKATTSSETRRDALMGFAGLATTALVGIANANAAEASGAASFVGTFTDPINHPGGKRTITLLDNKKFGDYQLAQVRGGGGRGEPADYVLPAAILGDRTIVIDFSPKGGPRDFVGVLDKKTGDITFPRDGNRWPRQ